MLWLSQLMLLLMLLLLMLLICVNSSQQWPDAAAGRSWWPSHGSRLYAGRHWWPHQVCTNGQFTPTTQLNSIVVTVFDNAMTSLALWRHVAMHRPRVVHQFGWAVEVSWVASALWVWIGHNSDWVTAHSEDKFCVSLCPAFLNIFCLQWFVVF